MTRGMVLGKFLPPHAGHLYLIGCARRQVEELAVVVEHLADEPMPSTERVAWVRALVPEATVVHLDRAMPQDPSETPNFWDRWRGVLRDVLPFPPDVVFASESYGHRLAAELGARFLAIDPARVALPVSGTAVRADPAAYARFLPPPVLAHYGLDQNPPPAIARRVAIVGPESTGKSTLARWLATELETVFVPEHAHTLITAGVVNPAEFRVRDFEDFARGQTASEEELAPHARDWLVCDSDALTTRLYADALLGSCPAWIVDESQRPYDLTLLCAPDVPWEDDLHRVDREGRGAMFDRFERELAKLHRRTVVLRGDWESRRRAALQALRATAPGDTGG